MVGFRPASAGRIPAVSAHERRFMRGPAGHGASHADRVWHMRFSRACPAAVPGSGVTGAVVVPFEPAEQSALHDDAVAGEVSVLFDELRSPVLRYLIAMGLAPADAEDILQDAFLALFNHLRRSRPRTNLKGWVFRTAHNLALKRRRMRCRESTAAGRAQDIDGSADRRLNPEQQVEAEQRYARMCAALGHLPDRDRFCLHLRAEGLRYRDIARTLGISLGTVSNSIRRSLAALAEAVR